MAPSRSDGETGSNGAAPIWLLADPGCLPPRLRSRAVPLALVALLAEEVVALENGGSLTGAAHDGVTVAALAARGLSASEIATRLHISQRTAYRRLARLRRAVGARNATELAARLTARGF